MQEDNFIFDPQKTPPNDICHDLLFREGQTASGEVTYTPRLVCADLKGSLGRLPQFGDLYDAPSKVPKRDSLLWDGELQVQKEEPKKPNDFQRELEKEEETGVTADAADSDDQTNYDLDRQVDVWSDYLRTRFHPRTNVILEEYQHDNPLKPFDAFGLGVTTWREDGVGEEIEDKLRSFAEEADNLQGFQVLSDNFDAFGGLGGSLVELLADEYSTKSAISFATSPATYSRHSVQENSARFLNTVLTTAAHCGGDSTSMSVLTPLSLAADTFVLPGMEPRRFGRLDYSGGSHYHTSAILATALESVTLPWRSSSKKSRMSEVATGISASGRRLAALEMCAPLFGRSTDDNKYLVDFLKDADNDGLEMVPITPGARDSPKEAHVQSVSVCGLDPSRWRPPDFR